MKKSYDGFDRILKIHFEDIIPDTKKELGIEMTKKGYRRKRIRDKRGRYYTDNEYPIAQSQLDYAWDYLNRIRPRQERLEVIKGRKFWSIEINNKTRANKYLIYKNKKYRKGQFLPFDIRKE